MFPLTAVAYYNLQRRNNAREHLEGGQPSPDTGHILVGVGVGA